MRIVLFTKVEVDNSRSGARNVQHDHKIFHHIKKVQGATQDHLNLVRISRGINLAHNSKR